MDPVLNTTCEDSALEEKFEQHRSNFPGLLNKSYFNYGGQGVLPRLAEEAIFNAYKFVQNDGPFSTRAFTWIGEELYATKRALSLEFGGEPESYAITQNATEGCNIVLWGIEWQAGDHLITTDCEHPGVVAAVQQIRDRKGVRVSHVSGSNDIVEEIERAIEKGKTRLVVLSHVLWNTGRTLPIDDIQQMLKQHDVQLLIDGAQSAGVVPLDLMKSEIDYYAITGHKWLCGPEGLGSLYIKPQLLESLQCTFTGWRSCMLNATGPTAARFEVATAPFPLLAGLRAAIAYHQSFGTPLKRFEHLRDNVTYLRSRLQEIDFVKIISPEDEPSGLVSFSLAFGRHAEIGQALEDERIILRTIPSPDCLRASVHYISHRNEIDALVEALVRLKK